MRTIFFLMIIKSIVISEAAISETEARRLLQNMHVAAVKGDWEGMKMSFTGSDTSGLLRAGFDLIQATLKIEEVLTNRFGPDALDRLNRVNLPLGQVGIQLQQYPRDSAWVWAVTFVRTNNTLSFLNPITVATNTIVLVDGHPKISLESTLPATANPQEIRNLFHRATRVITESIDFAKKEEVGLRELREFMSKRFISATH